MFKNEEHASQNMYLIFSGNSGAARESTSVSGLHFENGAQERLRSGREESDFCVGMQPVEQRRFRGKHFHHVLLDSLHVSVRGCRKSRRQLQLTFNLIRKSLIISYIMESFIFLLNRAA